MDYRHEWKHHLNREDLLVLRQRLRAVAKQDPHAVNGRYTIRSLYFDSPEDKALREKLDGVNRREKFRIRYYNGDPSVLHLEKKCKTGNLCGKVSTCITPRQAQQIVDGQTGWMGQTEDPLLRELYTKMRLEGLRPKTIVDYTREPFVYAPGNVRITLDYHIRTGLGCTDFLNPDCVTVPAGEEIILLEVKWDEFLPEIIRDAIQLPGWRAVAFSKYAQCRIYG